MISAVQRDVSQTGVVEQSSLEHVKLLEFDACEPHARPSSGLFSCARV